MLRRVFLFALLILIVSSAAGLDGDLCTSHDDCISQCNNDTRVVRLCLPEYENETFITTNWTCQGFDYLCNTVMGEKCMDESDGPVCQQMTPIKTGKNDTNISIPCPSATFSNSTEVVGKYTYYKDSRQGSGDCKDATLEINKYYENTYVGTYSGAGKTLNDYSYHCLNPKGMDVFDDSWGYVDIRYSEEHEGDYPTSEKGNYSNYFYNVCGSGSKILIRYCDPVSQPSKDLYTYGNPTSTVAVDCMDFSSNKSIEKWDCISSNHTYTLPDGKKYEGKICGITKIIEPEEKDECEIKDVKGSFQPTQGIWQDDENFTYYLRNNSDTIYRARIPMVKGRPTLIYGSPLYGGQYGKIMISGISTYTQDAPITIRFTLKQPGEKQVLYESNQINIPLSGKCGEERNFTIEIPTTKGLPANPFIFKEKGPYILEAEAFNGSNSSVGIKVNVLGEVVETKSPLVRFDYAVIQTEYIDAKVVEADAKRIMNLSSQDIPDYYPIGPGTFRTKWGNFYNYSELRKFGATNMSLIIEDLTSMRAVLSNVDRIMLVVHEDDLSIMFPNSAGYTASAKAVVISRDEDSLVVAHELVHTLPYLWSGGEMLDECGHNYHNYEYKIANGAKVTGTDAGLIITGRHALMGKKSTDPFWITQCTYMHLLEELQEPVDPEVILVHGFISRNGTEGSLGTIYQVDSIIDLSEQGNWSVILRDSGNAVLENYSMSPTWTLPDTDVLRNQSSFLLRMPYHENVKKAELYGPDGLLDSRTYSDNRPELTILEPANESSINDTGSVYMKWNGSDADGDRLIYTVLYSNDDQVWSDVLFESNKTELTLSLSDSTTHYIKVIANDGTQSTESIVRFNTGSESIEEEEGAIEMPEEEPGICSLPFIAVILLLASFFLKNHI